jgi:hypothetical protein
MDGPRQSEEGRDAPTDETILAAVRRASLHEAMPHGGASLRIVLAHLGIARRSGRARAVRARLAQLQDEGRLSQIRRHGIAMWKLTPGGARRLAAAEKRAGAPVALPESPQHIAWRNARVAAEAELGRFAASLAADVAATEAMLAALGRCEGPESDEWLHLGRRLLGDCRRLGSAWHCAKEWREPEDSRPDRDRPGPGEPAPADALRALRAGRRNTTLWGDPD